MNITRENIDELNGQIRLTIEKNDYQTNVEDVLKDYRKKVNMPGFRPGKVPAGLVKKMYGKSIMVDEVNKLISSQLSKYMVDEKLDILGEPLPSEDQPEIDWETQEDFEFIFDIGYAPEVAVKFDKRNKFAYHIIKVADEMINEQVNAYTNQHGENVPADVVAADETVRGDIAQLDAEGKVVEDGLSAEMALISVAVIKDEEIKKLFEGKKVGDEVVFDLRKAYPNETELSYLLNIEKEAAAEVSGDFKIEIKEINKFVPAEINEAFFKKVYGEETEIKDEAAFRSKIENEIKTAFTPSSDYKFTLDVRDTLVAKSKLEFPEAFLKRWLAATNKELTADQIENDFENFLTDLKWQVIKENIIKDNELKVEDSEVVELAKEVAAAQFRQYGMFDIPAEHLDGFVQQMLSKDDERSRLYQKAMEDKVIDVIKSKVAVDEKETTKEEFDAFFAAK